MVGPARLKPVMRGGEAPRGPSPFRSTAFAGWKGDFSGYGGTGEQGGESISNICRMPQAQVRFYFILFFLNPRKSAVCPKPRDPGEQPYNLIEHAGRKQNQCPF